MKNIYFLIKLVTVQAKFKNQKIQLTENLKLYTRTIKPYKNKIILSKIKWKVKLHVPFVLPILDDA